MYKIDYFKLRSEDAIAERASTGWLMKWDLGDYWIKSPGYIVNYTWDSVAEALASCIIQDLNLDLCLEYKLCVINVDGINLIGCISKNYNKPGLRELKFERMIKAKYLSRSSFFGKDGYNQLIKEIKETFNVDIRKYLENTILIDSIILNSDRNLWNMSIMVDNQLQGHLALIYDLGNSLGLTGGRSGSFYDEYKYSTGLRARPFDSEFENQVKYIRNNREFTGELVKTKEMLKLLYDNFTVNNNNRYNVANPLTDDTLKYVYQLIMKRYNTIIVNKLWKD